MKRERLNRTPDKAFHPCKLMLDSGAFTVYQQGSTIDLKAYIRFIQEHHDILDSYVSLDVIPGEFGKKVTKEQREAAAKASWKNTQRMRKEGLEPIPVYHYGERHYWLDKMIGEGYKTIGLGGFARLNRKLKRGFLDEVFCYLCGPRPFTDVRFHGFGVTSPWLVQNYPWASVDSVSWMLHSGFGTILVPRLRDGRWDYDVEPHRVNMAERKPGCKPSKATINGKHFNAYGPEHKRHIQRYLDEQGIPLPDVQNNYLCRAILNVRWFHRFGQAHVIKPYIRGGASLFASKGLVGADNPPNPFKFIFSMTSGEHYTQILNYERCDYRLLSYHRIVVDANVDLQHFVSHGFPSQSMTGDELRSYYE